MANNNVYASIKIEGGLLSLDLIDRLRSNPDGMEGLSAEDYHLAGNERLNEIINRSWNRNCTLWQNFKTGQNKLSEKDLGTTLTRDSWLLHLLQELGYGRLTPAKSKEIEGKSYPISHMWQNSPIHLLGFRIPLDRRTPGAQGAATMNPHSMVQEFLNRSDECLWGIVSNGLQLRLLRDNSSISRQAYIEFDLEAMMDGELYADYVIFWLLCHQSRLEAEIPADCWLEKWVNTVQAEGTRVLDRLREGVMDAITQLGTGFLDHPANSALRESLYQGNLDKQDYYRELLRLVYRIIFLCTAEDRDLLFEKDVSSAIRSRYINFYSMHRFRELASKRRGSKHHDLFNQFKLIMRGLGQAIGLPSLGIPPLGSYLWSDKAIPNLIECEITNRFLLSAFRSLTLHREGTRLVRVDFRHLGAEEFGSVYESLLEQHPEMHIESRTFVLNEASGNERKTTGSYYTPTSLINCLLDSALNPVIEEATKQKHPEEAILKLKVCDPACGSGQFLVGAARRIAFRLAMIRCGEIEPPADMYKQALREVVSHCIYGVDVNEMAVELCKINLWLESLEPGKPLSFLDHHIKCGNSLLYTTPVLISKGIPSDAFEAIEGDNRKHVQILKRQNQEESMGQGSLFVNDDSNDLASLSQKLQQLDGMQEDTFQSQAEKERLHSIIMESKEYSKQRLIADTWCGAFVGIKNRDILKEGITQGIVDQVKKAPGDLSRALLQEIVRLSKQYRFFHWHIEFPDVFTVSNEEQSYPNIITGWSGGFDVVLGNPPWERIKVQEKEWFASRVPEITQAQNATARRRLINDLKVENPELLAAFLDARRQSEGESHIVRKSGIYPLCGRGDINSYAIFAELMRTIVSPTGRIGCIVPSGIATDDTTKLFFQDLMIKHSLVSYFDFHNSLGVFRGVDRNTKFCLITINGRAKETNKADICCFLGRVEDLDIKDRHYELSKEDIELINPNTKTCPLLRTFEEAEMTKCVYHRVPIFIKEGLNESNPWNIRFHSMFHMTNDSKHFRSQQDLVQQAWQLDGNVYIKGIKKSLPLYEAKMMFQYDNRFSNAVDTTSGQRIRGGSQGLNEEKHKDPRVYATSRYWVDEEIVREFSQGDKWYLVFRDITGAVANVRTTIATIIGDVAVANTLPILIGDLNKAFYPYILTNLNSYILDFFARQKISGLHLNFFVMKQLPIIPPECYQTDCQWCSNNNLGEWILGRLLELTYTSWDLLPFANDCGYHGTPFRWDEQRRFFIRCELDAAYFHLYGIERNDVDYIMDTFPIVKRKDEAAFGSYRTKETILLIYDQMKAAMDSGEPYQTPLHPPPGPPEIWPLPPGTPWPEHVHKI